MAYSWGLMLVFREYKSICQLCQLPFPYHHITPPTEYNHSAVDTICICDHEPGKRNHIKFFFLVFSIDATEYAWNLKHCFCNKFFLCLIVMYSWFVCTPFGTPKKYMKKWNFDSLIKKLKRLVFIIKSVLSIIPFLACCNKQSFNKEHVRSTPHSVSVTTRITNHF